MVAGACLTACSGGHESKTDGGRASTPDGTASEIEAGVRDAEAGVSDAEPPSCSAPGELNGLTNCGANRDSCCTSLPVAGGTYYRTFIAMNAGPMGLADPATVSTFRLDKYEVTVGRFRRFVSAWNRGAGFTPPVGSGKHSHLNAGLGLANGGTAATYESGWSTSDDKRIAPTDDNLGFCGAYATWTPSPSSQENLPINCVNWWEAYAFCIWDGGFLATEAEWKYTAAGGSQQREFPWGGAPPGSTNEYAIYSCCYPAGAGSCTEEYCTGAKNIAPVGTASLGAGAWGQLDLAGSLWEWNLDYYPDDGAFVDPCTNCAYLTPTSVRVVKVSNFAEGPQYLPTWIRYDYDPGNREIYLGFRCARAP